MKRRAGFSLVEALVACALLGILLLPAIATLRSQLASAERLRARGRLDALLAARLTAAELRLRQGVTTVAPAGFDRDGRFVIESEPVAEARGPLTLWRLAIEVRDTPRALSAAAEQWLLLPTPPRPETAP